MRILTFLITLITSITLITTTHAQSLPYGWQIDSFNSDIEIKKGGTVSIVETLQVDFDSLEKHGIFRDIPYIYNDNNGTETYTKIEVIDVLRNGSAEKYTTTSSNGYMRIKIGDANKTISGNQTYQIAYNATGVLLPFEKYDELYWNVTGNYWDVPILEASTKVTLSSKSIVQTACYQGVYGSTAECTSNNNGTTANFKTVEPLAPNNGMTIAVGYQKGLVPILNVERPKTLWEQITAPTNLLLTSFTLLVFWTFIIRKWWRDGRDFWMRKKDLFDPNALEERRPLGAHETVVVEYAPPENLRPAELGTLIDQQADTRDVTATIIDLATRGFLKIEEVSKSWLFGKTDYNLIKKAKSTAVLLPYEKKLYDSLFSGRESVKISSLKTTFYTELAKVKDLLYENVVEKKLFIKRPDKVRATYYILAIFALAGSVTALIFGIANQIALLVNLTIGIIIGIIPLLVLANFMPRRTGVGRELMRRTKGYYLFIDKAEKHRQKFFENKNLFNEVLPYAITFGLVDKFARAMKDIGLKPQTSTWYAGTHAFNMNSFGHSIDSFSNSVSHSMASTPRSSGSGGGGFSGGGGGGGGGGSW